MSFLPNTVPTYDASIIAWFYNNLGSPFISPLPHAGETLQYTLVILDFKGINYNALLMQ